jgi:GNAT superfamily N-acetyltransferase
VASQVARRGHPASKCRFAAPAASRTAQTLSGTELTTPRTLHQTSAIQHVTIILRARFPADVHEVISIFREYVASPTVSLDFQDYESEFADLPGKYAEPGGRVLLARQQSAVVGCAALRRVNGFTCELKRVYVRPGARGGSIGRQLVEHMIREARSERYSTMCLDVLPEFVAAQQLYESLDFLPAAAVSYNPVPGTKFLALKL